MNSMWSGELAILREQASENEAYYLKGHNWTFLVGSSNSTNLYATVFSCNARVSIDV